MEARTRKDPNGKEMTLYLGGAFIDRELGGKTEPAHLRMFRNDKNDPRRKALNDFLFYSADYGYEGVITLGVGQYKAMLVDRLATGDFRGAERTARPGVQLMIDVNKNGRFDRRGETYDVHRPFNIQGTTYEIAGLPASGAEFRIRKSDQSVAEILPPPDLSPGRKAIRFTARTTDGQEVNFPSAYAGKLVMLHFGATWCGPCIAELPHLTKAYEQVQRQRLRDPGHQPRSAERRRRRSPRSRGRRTCRGGRSTTASTGRPRSSTSMASICSPSPISSTATPARSSPAVRRSAASSSRRRSPTQLAKKGLLKKAAE